MGLRLRKTIKLGKHIKLNISKSGISASIGKKGASVNLSSKGIRTTVGIPGTGISYSKQIKMEDLKALKNTEEENSAY